VTCPRQDDVVAHFLDGDPADGGGGPTAAHEDGLHAHLRGCASCRSALARSRHLDAMLAATTSVPGLDAIAERLLARTAATLAPPARPGRPRPWLPWAAAAAGFVLGLLATTWRFGARAPLGDRGDAAPSPAAPSERVEPGSLAAEPAWLKGMLILPEAGTRDLQPALVRGASPAVREVKPTLPQLAEQVDSDLLDRAIAMQDMARSWTLRLPFAGSRRVADLATVRRIAAGTALLQLPAPAALPPLCRALDRRDAAGAALRDLAAAHREFRLRLRAALVPGCQDHLCTAAARLGDPALDRRLLALCRRDDVLTDAVATACAGAARGVDRVAFLLELWAQASRGGDDAPGEAIDDVARAGAWFPPLPPRATAALLQTLQTTRSGEVRRRVFLALGARADGEAFAQLLAWIESPNATDAALAAYALGCHDPRFSPRLAAAARTSRRPELVWAALVSQGDGRVRPMLRAAGLSADEIELVTAGRLRPEQLDAVASLLRGRRLALAN